MTQAMKPGASPHDPLALELRKSLRACRNTIDELTKIECTTHLTALVQTNPSARTKNSTCTLASVQASTQARLLEFAATQEDCAVSTASTPVAL